MGSRTITNGMQGSILSGEYVKLTSSSRKLLRDGQIYILRDGKTYTAQGQEVK